MSEKERIDNCIERFRNLIVEHIDMADLHDRIDDVMIQYAVYSMRDRDTGNDKESEANNIYFLKMLRDILKEK